MLKNNLPSLLLLPAFAFAFQPEALADIKPDGFNLTYGQYLPIRSARNADYDNVRIGLVWEWEEPLYQWDSVQLDGFFELSGSHWNSTLKSKNKSPNSASEIWAVSFSPVFRVMPIRPLWENVTPFIDAGVGGTWISEKDLEKEKTSPINMGGHFQFEVRLMAGFRFGNEQQYELRYGWIHYSNADLYKHNESMNFHLVTAGWYW